MKARRLRKVRLNMHGYPEHHSSRVETGGPDPYTGKWYPKRTARITMTSGGRLHGASTTWRFA